MDDIPLSLPLLLDGATGTQLQAQGMPMGVCTEEWILAHPEALLNIQMRYVDAGAQVLLAPTFGASPAALARFGLAHKAQEYNRDLVALSRKAADGRAMVAGDLAPCGLGMELPPAGTARFEEIVDNYKVQVAALKSGGVDLYIAETMVSLAEARAAALAISETDPGKPFFVSFYCNDDGRTMDNTDVLAALIVLQGMGAAAFGLNCVSPEIIAEQLERLAPYAHIPLLALPGFTQPAGDDELSRWAEGFANLGVRIFGGCCGSRPEQISALKATLDRLDLPPLPQREQDNDIIFCACSQEARFLTPDVDVAQTIECSPSLLEDILDMEDEPHGALKISILDMDDLDLFAAHQYAVQDRKSVV